MIEQDEFTFDDVWLSKSEDVKEEIITFWLNEGALPSREVASKRVDQVSVICRNSSGGRNCRRQHNIPAV